MTSIQNLSTKLIFNMNQNLNLKFSPTLFKNYVRILIYCSLWILKTLMKKKRDRGNIIT